MLRGVDARPGNTAIRGSINAAAHIAGLIGISRKDFITVARIYQNACEITERKVTTAAAG